MLVKYSTKRLRSEVYCDLHERQRPYRMLWKYSPTISFHMSER